MTELGFLDIPANHSTKLNDIWGYTDEVGNEYALVGTEDGVSVVNVSDPSNPIEYSWVDGMYSIWRDIKVYGDYAYVTTEAQEGLLILDLTGLPGSPVTPYTLYTGPVGNEWYSAHNLYEDDGYLYIFGANRGNGGVIILDVFTDPLNPIEVGEFDNWYAHDGYVRDDTGYFANINDGFFSVVDLTDKSNPVFLGSSQTPNIFTHNIWTSDDGDIAFTTDEVAGGYIGSYDVSDPTNIKYLDKIQSSAGDGIVPHNAHVLGDYIVTSYYTDGLVIHDATHPYNLVEVANFDTSPLNAQTTEGCWGAYPFFASGNILATDREEGLFILNADYHQGAYLEGVVTEFGTGTPLNDVEISFDSHSITDHSSILGDYATGIDSTGTYDITYFKLLYYPQTVSVDLTEGIVASQDIELVKIPQFFVTVTVLDAQTMNPIENAEVILDHSYIAHTGATDVNGEVVLGLYYEDNYDLAAGQWGYFSDCFNDTLINSAVSAITLYLNEGIYDDFTFDNGWSVFGSVDAGEWVRDVPVGVEVNGVVENPHADSDWDCGNQAFLTGNGSIQGNVDAVTNGETILMSPVFDLTSYTDPHLNYSTFYYNHYGPFYPNDTLFVSLFNGTETIDIQKIHQDNTNESQWVNHSITIGNSIALTSTMQLILRISDYPETVNVCDAAFDNFYVTDYSIADTEVAEDQQIAIFPNPFKDVLNIRGLEEPVQVVVFEVSGRKVLDVQADSFIDVSDLDIGMYVIVLSNLKGEVIKTSKHIKE
jgi:choice-of-anchor B domain-containing protein